MKRAIVTTLLVAAGLQFGPAPRAQQDPILQAMQEEMRRAMDGLRMGNEPRPYYIAYAIEDTAAAMVSATLGTVVNDSSSHRRSFRVDVRVGDYNVDSSRFVAYGGDPGMLSTYGQYDLSVPLDDDYYVMRREIWLATDAAYKRAVQTMSKKKAAAQNRTADPEPIPDFSRETPAQTLLPAARPALTARTRTEDLRRISAVFLGYPEIVTSDVSLAESQGTRYYLNSEGSTVVEPFGWAMLRVVAGTQAADGMMLRDFFTANAKTLDGLPSAADIATRARDLAAGLTALRAAPIGEDFTGPVLVEDQAAPLLLAQTLVPLFLSQRAPEMDGVPAAAMRFPLSPYLTRIGARVLPEAFTVGDTPSLERFGSTAVPAAYRVDDDGVPAKDVTLVRDGRLVTLLTDRTPQRRLPQSNGHSRGGGAQASVFQVESARAVPAAELKATYLAMLKAQDRPFGYIVRAVADPLEMQMAGEPMDGMVSVSMGMASGGPRIGPAILRVVKVLADGTEQPVRGLNFANVEYRTFRDIAEASRERSVYTCTASMSGMGALTAMSGRRPLVSMIVPSLLFEELELQRTKDAQMKPPVVPSPLKK